jgi:hypothetical protein
MGVVMAVFWWRLQGVSLSIIRRCLDKKTKKQYKAYFTRVQSEKWLKKLNMEV